jgi:hypothetical protein
MDGDELWEYRFGEPGPSEIEQLMADAPEAVADLPDDMQVRPRLYLEDLPEVSYRRVGYQALAWVLIVTALIVVFCLGFGWGRRSGVQGDIRLDVEFRPLMSSQGLQERCSDLGGELIYYPAPDTVWVCEGIDH